MPFPDHEKRPREPVARSTPASTAIEHPAALDHLLNRQTAPASLTLPASNLPAVLARPALQVLADPVSIESAQASEVLAAGRAEVHVSPSNMSGNMSLSRSYSASA
jgi:hypothetical protein